MQWFSSLPVQLQAALIGAVAALVANIVVVAIRDWLLKLWQERRQTKQSAQVVYRRYADPLAIASTSLLWRLNEVFYLKGRAAFLKAPKPRTDYETYKRTSTLYRLAVLLGWIRAYRRELSFLSLDGGSQLHSIEAAVHKLESALGDGPHIEMQRLEGLARLWEVELPEDEAKKAELAVRLDQCISYDPDRDSVVNPAVGSEQEQAEMCQRAASLISEYLNTKAITQDVIAETRARAVQQVAVREAWIYRDWQSSIGDLMIQRVSEGDRRFEVIGYRDFEDMFLDGKVEEQRWLRRMEDMVTELDVSRTDKLDARIEQLRKTMLATAELVLALAEVEESRSSISELTLETAKRILSD